MFTIHLERRSEDGTVGQSFRSKLRLVDLAGSERVVRTGSVGQTLQEAKCVPFFCLLLLLLLLSFCCVSSLRCECENRMLLLLLLTHTIIFFLSRPPLFISQPGFPPHYFTHTHTHRYINKSLTFLEQMVIALGAKENGTRDHVPYRSSKLTHLLKDCVGTCS